MLICTLNSARSPAAAAGASSGRSSRGKSDREMCSFIASVQCRRCDGWWGLRHALRIQKIEARKQAGADEGGAGLCQVIGVVGDEAATGCEDGYTAVAIRQRFHQVDEIRADRCLRRPVESEHALEWIDARVPVVEPAAFGAHEI